MSRAVLPLSQSPVWNQQRAFYEDNASEAFAEIPHQAVDNPWVAAAYARVIAGFLRDVELDPSEPLYVLELGAGAGRFAHGLARELGERISQDFVYVLTDFADSQLDDWEAHPGLEDERFDFARVDLTQPIAPVLRRRGTTLRGLANPLVVIANYVFDSIPADAFAVAGGALQACLVDADFSFGRAPVDALRGRRPRRAARALPRRRSTTPSSPCRRPRSARCAVFAHCRRPLAGARRRQGAEHRGGARATASEPEPARHAGAFSLMVNFHALGFWAQRHGGELLHGGDRHAAIDVGALVFGPSLETRAAYEDAIERFGPGDLAILERGDRTRRRGALGGGDRRAAAARRVGRVDAARRARVRCATRPPTPIRPRRRTSARRCSRSTSGTSRSPATPTSRSRSACCCSSWRTTRTRSSTSRRRSSSTATIRRRRRTSSCARPSWSDVSHATDAALTGRF